MTGQSTPQWTLLIELPGCGSGGQSQPACQECLADPTARVEVKPLLRTLALGPVLNCFLKPGQVTLDDVPHDFEVYSQIVVYQDIPGSGNSAPVDFRMKLFDVFESRWADSQSICRLRRMASCSVGEAKMASLPGAESSCIRSMQYRTCSRYARSDFTTAGLP